MQIKQKNTHKGNTNMVKQRGESQVGGTRWGEIPQDNFGYKDAQERRAKRGLEDWEMVEDHVVRNGTPGSSKKWMLYSMLGAAAASAVLLLYLINTSPGEMNFWTSGHFSNGVFVLIFFCVVVYTSGVFKFIHDNSREGHIRKGEKRVLIGVLLGIALAVVLAIIQMLQGRQL